MWLHILLNTSFSIIEQHKQIKTSFFVYLHHLSIHNIWFALLTCQAVTVGVPFFFDINLLWCCERMLDEQTSVTKAFCMSAEHYKVNFSILAMHQVWFYTKIHSGFKAGSHLKITISLSTVSWLALFIFQIIVSQ